MNRICQHNSQTHPYMVKSFKKIEKKEEKKPARKPTVLGGSSSNSNCSKLTEITPYANNWEVEIIIASKQPVREWNNAKGSGKIQTIIVQDKSGKMQLKLWKTDVDRFGFMEEGKCYRLSGCQLKPADKKWNKTGTDYEMHSAQSMQCTESTATVEIEYNFIKLNEVSEKPVDSTVDVVGIIYEVEEAREITFQASQRTSFRRNFSIVDNTNAVLRVTLWGKNAEEFVGQSGMAVEVSGALVREWQSVKNLNAGSDTSIKIRDQMDENAREETSDLFSWWNAGGSSQKFEGSIPQAGGGDRQNFATIKTLKE